MMKRAMMAVALVMTTTGGAALAARDKTRPVAPMGNQGDWFPVDSYPPEARRANEQGRVSVVVEVDATGRPSSCAVSMSSGSAALDRTTCELAMRNARFTPALDADGRAIPSRFTMRNVVWSLESPNYDVGNGPVVVPMPARMVTELDAEGRITDCYSVNADGSRGEHCPAEMIGKTGGPVATRGGVPVPSRLIQEMKTTLEARDPAPPR